MSCNTFENCYGIEFSKEEAQEFLDLSAKFGEMRRANMELLEKAGKPKFPNMVRYITDQSVVAYLEARKQNYREGSPIYDYTDELIRGINDLYEIPTAAYIRYGTWEQTDSGEKYCSCCGYFPNDDANTFSYCPHCGSCMNGESKVCREYTG